MIPRPHSHDTKEKYKQEEYYRNNVQPHALRLEKDRKEAHKTYKKRMPFMRITLFLMVASQVIFFAALWGFLDTFIPLKLQDHPYFIAILLGPGALFVATALFAQRPKKQYIQKVKDEIYPTIFSYFGSSFSYGNGKKQKTKTDLKPLKEFGIIPSHSDYDIEDCITGTYKGVDVEIIETTLKADKGKEIFKGFFLLLSVKEPFSGKVVLLPDNVKTGQWFYKIFTRLENTQFQNNLFEETFEVFANNETDAKKLITSDFQENITKLAHATNTKTSSLRASFHNQQLLLLIPHEDIFKIPPFDKPIDFEKMFQTIINEVYTVFHIIETLKINKQ